MTKRELLDQINMYEVANKLSDLEASLQDCLEQAKKITRLVEDITDDESEITDDESEKS